MENSKLVVINGNFPKSGIALPCENRRIRASALQALYLYKGKNFWSKAKINFLRLFNFSFVWRILFRKKFVITPDSEWATILSFIKSQLSDVVCSIYVGSGKYNLPLFDAKSGKPLGHAKVYFPESAGEGEHEAEILDSLRKIELPDFSFPEVLAKGRVKGFFVEILAPLQGATKRIRGICKDHLKFLEFLSEKTGKREIFKHSDFYREFQKQVEFLKSALPEESGLVEYVWSESLKNLKGKEFLLSLTKREFPFFEMLKIKTSDVLKDVRRPKYCVLDWEPARFGFPPVFDLFSLLMSGSKYKKGGYEELYKKNMEDLFFRKNKKAENAIKKMLGFWRMNTKDAYWFFLLFLLDQLAIHLELGHEKSSKRVTTYLAKIKEKKAGRQEAWLALQ